MGAEGTNHVRLYHWVMPWNQIRQTGAGPYYSGHMWVPIDDYHTMVYNWDYLPEGALEHDPKLDLRAYAERRIMPRLASLPWPAG